MNTNRADLPVASSDDRPTPPIPHALTLLDSHLKGLENDISRLENKIRPVMGPGFPEDDSPASPKTVSPNSEMVGILGDFCEAFTTLRGRLDRLIDRVEF